MPYLELHHEFLWSNNNICNNYTVNKCNVTFGQSYRNVRKGPRKPITFQRLTIVLIWHKCRKNDATSILRGMDSRVSSSTLRWNKTLHRLMLMHAWKCHNGFFYCWEIVYSCSASECLLSHSYCCCLKLHIYL